jgi:hypothetical protein
LSEYMGFGDFLKSNFNKVKQAGEKTGRFIGTTGRSALRKLGDGAASVKRVGQTIDKATGGVAGTLFDASQSLPIVGTVTRNLEKGLDLAEKASSRGLGAIDKAENIARRLR